VDLVAEIKKFFKGEVENREETLQKYSRDASLFEIKPRLVVFPKDVEDLKNLVKFVTNKRRPKLSLTMRAAGTDMTGGPLSESIVVDVTRHFNRIIQIGQDYAIVEPGVYYRNFEKEAARKGLFLPSYPASKELCALGGMVANNSGGEKSLIYGKTEKYVESLRVVLADGEEYEIHKISKEELQKKIRQKSFDGEIYRQLFELLEKKYDAAKNAKPAVSKNSSGYNIWDLWDSQWFDLVKIFVGSQGTLGIITQIKLRLVKIKPYSGLAAIYLKDLTEVANLVRAILPLQPSSLESFDDHTLKLAFKFLPSFVKLLGAKNVFSLLWQFLPDFWTILTFGMPKLILLAEFEGGSRREVNQKLSELKVILKDFRVRTRYAPDKESARKYWAIRRESFNLLRQKIKDKQTAPFIDDFVIKPEKMPEFLPQVYEILDRYQFLYTIAGHAGEGNFHIIPLMMLADPMEREKIPAAADEIYKLVLKYRGSMSGEHNDGLVRGPYLRQMFGDEVYRMFEQIKKIFDPKGIFNPGKKIGASLEYALDHIRKT